MTQALTDTLRLIRAGAAEIVLRPAVILPAAAWLLPTLALQLAVPGHLRTRLAPSMWTVVAGGLFMAWVTQVAVPLATGAVHVRRGGSAAMGRPRLIGAVWIGSLAMIGLLAGGLPGLWLQGRLGFLPLMIGRCQSIREDLAQAAAQARLVTGRLVAVAAAALLVSVLGQSLVAAMAEAAGTISPVAVVDGRTTFGLAYGPHALTSVLAYACAVVSVTLQAACLSICFDQVSGRVQAAPFAPAEIGHGVGRLTVAATLIVLLCGAAAAVFKVQQHF